jgi:hypothetical protein
MATPDGTDEALYRRILRAKADTVSITAERDSMVDHEMVVAKGLVEANTARADSTKRYAILLERMKRRQDYFDNGNSHHMVSSC